MGTEPECATCDGPVKDIAERNECLQVWICPFPGDRIGGQGWIFQAATIRLDAEPLRVFPPSYTQCGSSNPTFLSKLAEL